MVQCLAGLATAWLVFYLAGHLLLSLPDSFHEGTLWKGSSQGFPSTTEGAPKPSVPTPAEKGN